MRVTPALVLVLFACGSPGAGTPPVATTPPPAPAAPAASTPPERLTADSPRTTVAGHPFVAPAGWSLSVRGAATILEAPEGGSTVAFVDVTADGAEAAVAAAWAVLDPSFRAPLERTDVAPDRDGWTQRRSFVYRTSPNDQRDRVAEARRAGQGWTVVVQDLAWAVAERRSAEVDRLVRISPRGHAPESLAGKTRRELDAGRIAELVGFVRRGQQLTGIPGVALGLIDRGEVVFAGGLGVRALGEPAEVDADTRFMIASNTKTMTTLMLAKLVDEGRLTWDTPATAALPAFALGDAATTRKVRVKHLVCACAGMPRQDMEWLFESEGLTPARVLASLATMQPTSEFGEVFQYSNVMFAAGGFLGGHVAHPELELGAAYDRAMQELVFGPLRMDATSFEHARRGNSAVAHALSQDGKPRQMLARLNETSVPVRPAGGASSTARDLLRYMQMELDEGLLPDGRRYIGADALLARRAPQVTATVDVSFGLGVVVGTHRGIPWVGTGGSLWGFYNHMVWLPEHDVGAVILTNGMPGWLLVAAFHDKLFEVLFDGQPEADAELAAGAAQFFGELAADRALTTVPADPVEVGRLARRYRSAELGELVIESVGGRTVFDFGLYASEFGSRRHPDGTVSFVNTEPLPGEFELVAGPGRTLILRDAQHEYVFQPTPE